MLQFLKETTPGANEQSQTNHLFSNLPMQIKGKMVLNMPRTVNEFIDQLKNFVRESKYHELTAKAETEKVTHSFSTAIQDLCQTIQSFQTQAGNSSPAKYFNSNKNQNSDNSANLLESSHSERCANLQLLQESRPHSS